MRTASAAVVLALTALLAACGSSSSTAPTTSPPPLASVSPTATVLQPTAGLTCDDLAKVATTLTTNVHYVALNVGTTNDSSTYYPQLDQAMTDLTALTGECAAKASDAVAALGASVAALEEGMAAGTDPAVVDTNVALLATVRADGITAYKALKLPTVGWENAPENRVIGEQG